MLSVPIQAAVGVHVPRAGASARHVFLTARPGVQKRGQGPEQQQQRRQQQLPEHLRQQTTVHVHAASKDVVYEWSWTQGRSNLPEDSSPFDAEHPVPEQLHVQDVLALLAAAAAADSVQPSQAWMQQLVTLSQPLLQQISAADACQALQHLSQLDYTPDPQWMAQAMQQLCSQLQQLSSQQLSGLLWSLSNLRATPDQAHWTAILQASAAKLQDFYGPDLCQLVCAAGSIYSSSSSNYDPELGSGQFEPAAAAAAAEAAAPALQLPDGWQAAVASEVEYQVVEFVGDLGAFDLARLASGMADLGVMPSQKLQDALLKAVYMRTRTIEEKGAVDFALAKLDAKGKKSMHFDPRWTHEELKWLPGHERDKRRIIKENWYRTQWGGYGSGKT